MPFARRNGPTPVARARPPLLGPAAEAIGAGHALVPVTAGMLVGLAASGRARRLRSADTPALDEGSAAVRPDRLVPAPTR